MVAFGQHPLVRDAKLVRPIMSLSIQSNASRTNSTMGALRSGIRVEGVEDCGKTDRYRAGFVGGVRGGVDTTKRVGRGGKRSQSIGQRSLERFKLLGCGKRERSAPACGR